jgi:probable rRNA maturation factor
MVIIYPPLEDIPHSSLGPFVRIAQKLAGASGHVDVLITNNRRVRELNRYFRKKDKPTDVLSFPHGDRAGGGIAISAPIAAKNAARYGHSTTDELKILILHGMLHLAGYDHERDNGRMAAKETELRARLRLPVSLIERSTTSHHGDALERLPELPKSPELPKLKRKSNSQTSPL